MDSGYVRARPVESRLLVHLRVSVDILERRRARKQQHGRRYTNGSIACVHQYPHEQTACKAENPLPYFLTRYMKNSGSLCLTETNAPNSENDDAYHGPGKFDSG
jgi:hypothetical protein